MVTFGLMMTFVFLVVLGIVGGIIAHAKNRNTAGWAALCFLCPLFVIAILGVPALVKLCPSCGIYNPGHRLYCRDCRSPLDPPLAANPVLTAR